MPIRVIAVNGLRTPEERAGVAYVGRAWAGWPEHPLGNPFRPTGSGPAALEKCLDRYRDHLGQLADRGRLEHLLDALWDQTRHGELPLGCWCVTATAGDGSPVVCHAQILAEHLRERFCCAVCGKPAVTDYADREDCPSCGDPRCEIQMQAGLDYIDERG